MEMFDIGPLLVWAVAVSTLLSVGTTIWNLVNSGTKRNASALQEVSHRLDRHDGRIQALEQTVRSLPGREDMHRLELQLSEMNGKLGILAANGESTNQIMVRLEKMVGRHDDHLKDQNRK